MAKLRNPYSGREHSVHIEPQKEKLGEGIEGIVDVVKIRMSEGEYEMSHDMARKIFKDSEFGKKDLEVFVENWKELKKRGMPVVPTLRIEESGDTPYVIMTDLTEGGKNEVVALNDFEPSEEERKYLEADGEKRMYKYSHDEIVELSNATEIENQLIDLLKSATEKGVILEHDIPFLIIDKKTRKGRMVLGDLRTALFMETAENDEENEAVSKSIYEIYPSEIDDEGDTYIEMVNYEALHRWAGFLNENIVPNRRIRFDRFEEAYSSMSDNMWKRREEMGIANPDEDMW